MRAVGDMWTNSNKWMIESTRYSLVNADLEQLALSMLDDMIKLVKEKMSTMMDDDEDEDMKHCLTLRIWSLNTAMRGTLNDEHFRKGQQVDEWLRQASKGESKMDYTNMDARSTGMFWAMSYMTGQSACDTVISWLTSGGTELLSSSNLQSSDRIMVIREFNPVPISLL